MWVPRTVAFFMCVLGLVLASAACADDLRSGQRIFARWSDGYCYPGRVADVRDGKSRVAFDDHDSAWLGPNEIGNYTVEIGDRVEGKWRGGRSYYLGTVSARDGERITIRYDDGDIEHTTLAFIRMRLIHPSDLLAKVGSRVFADWGDGYWYPGAIAAMEGRRFQVRFDDGDSAWLDRSRVGFYAIGPGDSVEGNWRGSGKYYLARVATVNGARLRINYDDGDVENTTLARIRIRLR